MTHMRALMAKIGGLPGTFWTWIKSNKLAAALDLAASVSLLWLNVRIFAWHYVPPLMAYPVMSLVLLYLVCANNRKWSEIDGWRELAERYHREILSLDEKLAKAHLNGFTDCGKAVDAAAAIADTPIEQFRKLLKVNAAQAQLIEKQQVLTTWALTNGYPLPVPEMTIDV